MSNTKRILVYGGRGALGSACVAHFKQLGHWVCSVDIANNPDADANVAVSPSSATLAEQHEAVAADVAKVFNSNEKLDAVICVAGGWAGGDASSDGFVTNCELVLRQSVWTSVIAASLAAKHLASGDSLLVLTGAQPALGPTPGMIGYGMAKAAVHQMVRSLAESNSGLPTGTRTVAILPVTLDTPANRRAMGEANLSEWTPLEFVAKLIADWTMAPDASKPKSGSLLTLVTKGFKTEVLPA